MKKLKILQNWPLLHNGKALNRGDVAEFDDKYADWLLAHGRAEADKSLKTGGNNSAQASAGHCRQNRPAEHPQGRTRRRGCRLQTGRCRQ